MSLNKWIYTESNPVNYVDPTGHYGRDVHFDLTYVVGRIAGGVHCQGLICIVRDNIAELIAEGDQRMDDSMLLVAGVSTDLHFQDMPIVERNAHAAIDIGDPFLLGAVMHQVQDWHSHWNEGYRSPWGHAEDSRKAGCFPNLGCHRKQELIQEFYKTWSKEDVLVAMGFSYSQAELANVSEDKMVDLFIYTFGDIARYQRSIYGYDTDHYFGSTPRDGNMRQDTDKWITEFFNKIDPCDPWRYLYFTKPTDWEIRNFLRTGETNP